MDTTAQKMDAPLAWEQPLDPKIDEYLRHLAKRLHETLEIKHIRVHPTKIAIEVYEKLRAYENQLMSRREELAAHEFGEPHVQRTSIDEGRQELADLVAATVVPLAEVTHAYDLFLSIRIGTGLAPPFADEGLGICASFVSESHADGRHGVFRRRLAFKKETAPPPSEKNIDIGMTLMCWPGKIDFGQAYGDGTRDKTAHLMDGDNALYRMTISTLRVFEDRRQVVADALNQAEHTALKHAGDSLRVTLIALAMSRLKAQQDQAAQAAAETALPFADDLRQTMEEVKRTSPALSGAAQQYLTQLAARSQTAEARASAAPRTPLATHAEDKATFETAAAAEMLWGSRPSQPHAVVHIAPAEEPAPQGR